MKNRKADLQRFYVLLEILEKKIGGRRTLSSCSGKSHLPSHGVYFFMEPGEVRTHSGNDLRIVRVGTHGLKTGSKSTLWKRLSQHKGTELSGGGNHRCSIFRLLIGTTLSETKNAVTSWGQGSTTKKEVRLLEEPAEKKVSSIIREMPFLYLEVNDAPNPDSLRGLIERNSIALLSNFKKIPMDPPSNEWLGKRCMRERVRLSGLWNQNHVDDCYDPAFLTTMELLINNI